jgi:hypothetical protein
MFIFDISSLIIGAMFGGIWASIFSTMFIAAVILLTATDEFWWSYGSLLLYTVILAIFTPANPFLYIWHNPLSSIEIFIGYFIIGAVFALLKYWSFIQRVVQKIKDFKKQFIIDNKLEISTIDEIPEEYKKLWNSYKSQKLSSSELHKINNGLRPSNNSALIMNWIAWWPFVAVGLFVADPLRKLVKAIYEHLVSTFGKMYEHIVTKNINMTDLK